MFCLLILKTPRLTKQCSNTVGKCLYSSGDVRKGGGSFSKKEQALEDQFFRQRVNNDKGCHISIHLVQEKEELEKYRKELAEKAAKEKAGKSSNSGSDGKSLPSK